MKFIPVACAIFLSVVSYGQSPDALLSLVNTERNFAKLSKDKSTREAFSTFLSDSGLIFQPGPVIGKKFWQQAKEGTELLTWEPVFAAVAAAGDMGYTTGPWEFRKNRSDTNAAAMGYFVSVWKKEKEEWKVALDIGISFPASTQKENAHFPASPSVSRQSRPGGNWKKDLMKKEQEFISLQNKNGWNAYTDFILDDTRIYRPGSFPFITGERRKQLFSETGKKFSYLPVDAVVSASNDLGYVYGKAFIEISKDDTVQRLDGNYLRIWKQEKDNSWKIVLDLVNIAR